jgi:hypothetical protein
MADGSIFDNGAAIAPIDGQAAAPAENNTTGTQSAAPAAEPAGQAAEGAAANTQTTQPATQKTWQDEFKTPEEMYEALSKTKKSYEDLRPAYTKATQDLSALRKTQQPAAQPAQQGDAVAQLLGRVAEIVAPVKEQTEEIMMTNTLQRLANENPDMFKEVAPQLKTILESDPTLWQSKSPIETAFRIAKAEYLEKNMGSIAKDIRNQAYADKEQKVLGNTGRTTGTQMNQQPASEEDVIRESILNVSRKQSTIFG